MTILICVFLLSFCQSFCSAASLPTVPERGLLGLEIVARADAESSAYALCDGDTTLFSGDQDQCIQERLRLLQIRHGMGRVNIRVATLGGKQYWSDCYLIDGWRIQQHINTGHFRLLNQRDVRYAWGSYAACRTALASIRFQEGFGEKIESSVVVLLHGILRSKDSLSEPEFALQSQGYETLNINYASRQGSIQEFAQQVHLILNQRPDIKQVSFVTHSMGGLVLRHLLADAEQPWRKHAELKHAVMIFPPNQGAYKANIWHEKWWYACIFGPAGQELCSSSVQTLPSMPMKTGIIIGQQISENGKSWIIPGNDDGTVGVEECKLDGVTDYAFHPVGHTYGMNNPIVLTDIISFIDHASFQKTVPE